MANISIFSIIIGKLRHRKKLDPVILLQIDKSLKVNFYCIILFFDLIIRLWIESSRKSPFDA